MRDRLAGTPQCDRPRMRGEESTRSDKARKPSSSFLVRCRSAPGTIRPDIIEHFREPCSRQRDLRLRVLQRLVVVLIGHRIAHALSVRVFGSDWWGAIAVPL